MSLKPQTNLPKFFYLAFLLFVLVIPLFALKSVLKPVQASAYSMWGSVLGEDEESDENDDSGEDENEDSDEQEDQDDSDADDNEVNDDGNEQKNETTTVTRNADGSRTVTKRKVEDDGKVEVEIKTYDANGRVVEEFKSKDENGESELEFKGQSFGENGKLTEIKFKSKDGEEIKLMIKNVDQTITKVRYDENHNYVRVIGNVDKISDDESEDGEEIETDDDSNDVIITGIGEQEYEIEHRGFKARANFPVVINDDTGELTLITSSGELPLDVLPDELLNPMDDREVNRIEIVEKDGKLVYQLSSEKAENLLGLFTTRIESMVTYDAQSGAEVESYQTFWTRVLDLLSF